MKESLVGRETVFICSRMAELPSSRRACFRALHAAGLFPILFESELLPPLEQPSEIRKKLQGNLRARRRIEDMLRRSSRLLVLSYQTGGEKNQAYNGLDASSFEVVYFSTMWFLRSTFPTASIEATNAALRFLFGFVTRSGQGETTSYSIDRSARIDSIAHGEMADYLACRFTDKQSPEDKACLLLSLLSRTENVRKLNENSLSGRIRHFRNVTGMNSSPHNARPALDPRLDELLKSVTEYYPTSPKITSSSRSSHIEGPFQASFENLYEMVLKWGRDVRNGQLHSGRILRSEKEERNWWHLSLPMQDEERMLTILNSFRRATWKGLNILDMTHDTSDALIETGVHSYRLIRHESVGATESLGQSVGVDDVPDVGTPIPSEQAVERRAAIKDVSSSELLIQTYSLDNPGALARCYLRMYINGFSAVYSILLSQSSESPYVRRQFGLVPHRKRARADEAIISIGNLMSNIGCIPISNVPMLSATHRIG